ncbi:hypothetical protein WJX72_008287 [[Myrmecia] bisecta]|uniref:UBX domain-containing protein n=1 Tax=[Myrmecia] bisecta TaxID=41462 RepID=A0AAW1QRT4_9CHLO
MLSSELAGRASKLQKEQKERAEKARQKAEKERLLQERVRQRKEAHEEENRQRRIAEEAVKEAERLRHEEDIARNKGVWWSAQLAAVPADEDAARLLGIRRGTDKVLLPKSASNDLIAQDVYKNGAMFFEIATPSGRATHVGALDFTAAEGTVALPRHVVRNLWGPDGAAECSGSVKVTYRKLAKGTYARFQPRTADFQKEVAESVEAVLEAALATHCALTEGDWIRVPFGGKDYDLRVQKLKPEPQVSVIDTDMEAEVEPSVETEERIRAEEAAAEERAAELRAAEAAAARKAREAEELEQELRAEQQRLRAEKEALLPPEPSTSSPEPTTMCLVRLPDGSRLSRRFLQAEPLQTVFDFVDARGGGGAPIGGYRLVTQFPRRVFVGESGLTLAQAGLNSGQEVLLLEQL